MSFRHTEVNLITQNAPISAQYSNLVVFRLQPVYSYLLYKNICCYSSESPQKVEAIQMSTNNICFYKYCVSIIKCVPHEVLCLSFFKVYPYYEDILLQVLLVIFEKI